MARFSYKAYDDRGALLSGDIDAATRELALELLRQQGRFPVEIAIGGAPAQLPWWQREVFERRELSGAALAVFTRELAALINASLPIDEALRIASVQPALSAKARQVTRAALADVIAGKSLSDALAARGGALPDYYCQIIRAGEASGKLGPVLEDLARFLERNAEIRSRVSGGLLYPAILVVAALIALSVIAFVLVPAIMPLFRDAKSEPPFLIRTLDGIRQLLTTSWPIVLASLAAGVAAVVLFARQVTGRTILDRTALRLPLIGNLITQRETARFSRTLATLLHSGVPLVDGLRTVAGVVRNSVWRQQIAGLVQQIEGGATLSAPLIATRLFPDVAERLIAVGERTGQLQIMLSRVADIHEAALSRGLDRVTTLITPVLTVLIGAGVGGLVLSVMSAITTANDLVLK